MNVSVHPEHGRPTLPRTRELRQVVVTLTPDEYLSLSYEARAMHAVDVETAAAALLTLGITTHGFRRARRHARAAERAAVREAS